jgi:hypothetical protein
MFESGTRSIYVVGHGWLLSITREAIAVKILDWLTLAATSTQAGTWFPGPPANKQGSPLEISVPRSKIAQGNVIEWYDNLKVVILQPFIVLREIATSIDHTPAGKRRLTGRRQKRTCEHDPSAWKLAD